MVAHAPASLNEMCDARESPSLRGKSGLNGAGLENAGHLLPLRGAQTRGTTLMGLAPQTPDATLREGVAPLRHSSSGDATLVRHVHRAPACFEQRSGEQSPRLHLLGRQPEWLLPHHHHPLHLNNRPDV